MSKNREDLGQVCDELFYSSDSPIRGNVGIKNLASVLSLSNEEFDNYIEDL